jgi:predicted nucleic acid-binding Zn ribbon protein
VTPSLRAQVIREWQPFAAGNDLDSNAVTSLSKLVPGVMKGLGLEQRLQQSQAFSLWPQIVGSDIAAHAQPVSLRNGTLVIAVDHPVWLQELSRYHKTLLLQKIGERIGKSAVRNIVFRIG